MFQETLLNKEKFCVNWELIPGRGSKGKNQDSIFLNAEKAAKSDNIHAVSITDNPGGSPALSVELVAAEIKKIGIDPVVHLACRDRNRNTIESMLHSFNRSGVENILVISGDYPSNEGFAGTSMPCFDLDSIHVMQLITRMNNGFEFSSMGRQQKLDPTCFFAGTAVSPFKITEAELYGQYAKLSKKINAGARFIITQIGFDARKFHELIQLLGVKGFDIPVIANIFVLSYIAGKAMYDQKIPGCVVTKKLLGQLAQERTAPDKGKASRIKRASEMYALTKGLGFAGVHLGGLALSFEMVEEIVQKGEELSGNWEELIPKFSYPQDRGFYLFVKNDSNNLNTGILEEKKEQSEGGVSYLFSRFMHYAYFDSKSPLAGMFKYISRFIDSRDGLKACTSRMEHLVKTMLFKCRDCGDCALTDVAYLCPMSQCPKGQRNGPCGGSHDGWCEVYPEKKNCVWVRAYRRLKKINKEDTIADNTVPPCNWALWQTSSWLNFFMGRDHNSKS